MTCGGLIAIGLILHLFTEAVDWSSFAWPLNICILTVYVVVLIMLYILRKKLYFVRWTMSYNAAVPSLIAVVFLTFLMGMIKQMPSSVSSDGFSIFNSMLSFLAFHSGLYLDDFNSGASFYKIFVLISCCQNTISAKSFRVVYSFGFSYFGKC